MKILLSTIFEYPHEGGLSTHVATLKNGLETLGHQVDVLSFTDLNPLVRKAYAQAPGFIASKIKPGSGQLMNDQNRMTLIHKELNKLKGQYDVVNTQDVYATLATEGTGIPVVETVHGYYSFEAISRGAIAEGSKEDITVREREKRAYTLADEVVTVDQRIKDYVKSMSGVEATAIKNFIDVEDFDPGKLDLSGIREEFGIPTDKRMLFVPRRMTEKNGVIYPTLALRKVLDRHPDTVLVYAGTGEQMPAIKKEVEQQSLDGDVLLLGTVPHEKMKYLYGTSDVVLVPSVHSYGVEEATSISALEAMGSRSPVIAGAVGGLKEIIEHEKDGLLVTEKDVDGLSKAILKVLDSPTFAEQLARNARTKIEQMYSHHSAAARFEEIYMKAANKA
ncbi:glycosyltransferase family 4 protein [Rossellomorea marisflavi]|uniref:Glycosyltransferase family 4 protein n=1 Tax=Rossellomorea marisflavi TaxID=189381 RepID=A0A5D4RRW1_9BACI|nr:glycosyltransferase family 4 protein [Rossellomorea marisflavi]KQU58402.1 glycosyl transferase family 1 [Bacillus sp. Leaf406]MDW4528429.1 glycosyltransferase family 4 protein [Rossellomorea marisflavi]TYS52464.1 glycosyltransferase family 4 protein [Rossellomorea marisflavi]